MGGKGGARVTAELVDEAVNAWYGALKAFALLQPEGLFQEGERGTKLLVTGVRLAFLNGVFSSARRPDAGAIIALLPARETFGLPWSIQVRGDQPSPTIVSLATESGRNRQVSLPFMIRQFEKAPQYEVDSDSLHVRRATIEDCSTYQVTMAAGFEGPAELFSPFSSLSVLGAPRMMAWLAEEKGIAVGTGFGVLIGNWVGIFNIATHPDYRRRGYGRAMIKTVLQDAYSAGARAAFLHGTPTGTLLYESMGFGRAENWTVFVPS
jgi:GNAT superfamily N-acetyltransferase